MKNISYHVYLLNNWRSFCSCRLLCGLQIILLVVRGSHDVHPIIIVSTLLNPEPIVFLHFLFLKDCFLHFFSRLHRWLFIKKGEINEEYFPSCLLNNCRSFCSCRLLCQLQIIMRVVPKRKSQCAPSYYCVNLNPEQIVLSHSLLSFRKDRFLPIARWLKVTKIIIH